jgi:hypothetical protein
MGLAELKQKIKELVKQNKLTPEQQLLRDSVLLDQKRKNRDTEAKLKIAIERIDEMKKSLSAFKATSDVSSYKLTGKSSKGGEATAVAVASDWHYWETVQSKQVNGLNVFNKRVAKFRSDKFFANVAKLVKIYQNHSIIDTLILALLGDFMNNDIHPELAESNQGLPMDELLAVQDCFASGIEYILKNSNVDLLLPCQSGNHARTTIKTHISTEVGHSLEYIMYHNLARYFKKEKRVKFLISRGYLLYVNVYGFMIRFHHGHAIKYGGGIGGATIPLNKAIAQWDKSQHADLSVQGHLHTLKDGGNFIINGSLVGYDDFALRIKADYEKPKQAFFLVDHKRKEKTVTCPIFLD